jgi:hypothetical protein
VEVQVKKLLLLVFVAFVLFVVLERQKLYLRDPLATVTVDDVVQSDNRVYINYSNDVLVEHTVSPVTLTIVQRNQHLGIPTVLRCLRWVGCLTDANPASLVQTMKGPVGEMSNRLVEYRDDDGHDVKVKLR